MQRKILIQACGALAAIAGCAHASSYDFLTLNPAHGVSAYNRGGMNNSGTVVGNDYEYTGSGYSYPSMTSATGSAESTTSAESPARISPTTRATTAIRAGFCTTLAGT